MPSFIRIAVESVDAIVLTFNVSLICNPVESEDSIWFTCNTSLIFIDAESVADISLTIM